VLLSLRGPQSRETDRYRDVKTGATAKARGKNKMETPALKKRGGENGEADPAVACREKEEKTEKG